MIVALLWCVAWPVAWYLFCCLGWSLLVDEDGEER